MKNKTSEYKDSQFELIKSPVIAEFLGFKKMNENHVVDEYFIDYDSKFIKNLNCLRIRKINNR